MDKFLNITNKSLEEFGVKTYAELWQKNQVEYKGLSCELPVTFEKTITKGEDDKDNEVYIMVASDDKEDRHGDIVMQNWIIGKNIPLLDSHNYDSITHIIGSFRKAKSDEHKLRGELYFSKANPKGQLAKEMVDEKTLMFSSVGFIPKEFDNEGRILKSELLEVSMVSVPANPRASLEKKADEEVIETTEIETVEEVVEPIAEEKPEEKVIETKLVIDKKKLLLNSIARAIKEMQKNDLEKQKRSILSALRNL